MTHTPLNRIAPALAAAALVWSFGPAAAQDSSCGGWTASCAAVEVRAEGDRLILFTPNATPPATETEGEARVPSDRVRVLADRPGAACDAATGAGCDDLTNVWSGAGTGAAPGGTASADDPGNLSCREDQVWMARARGMEEGETRCRRPPVAAFFLVALPVGLYVLGPDGEAPLIDHPLPGDPGTGVPGAGDGSGDGAAGSDASDGGTGGDSTGGGTGGDSAGGGTGGDASGGSTGGDSTGGGSTGGGSEDGNAGGGSDGGTPGGGSDSWDGTLGLPPESPRPPMSEVPEPISTTLFGLGLAGYAGTQLRKRRAARLEAEDAPV